MNRQQTINDVFPQAMLGKGIFYYMENNIITSTKEVLPWTKTGQIYGVTSFTLDMLYHGNHGDKPISPMVSKFIKDGPAYPIPGTDLDALGNIVRTFYLQKWQKLWDSLNFEYNPINNYDMVEELQEDGTNTGTVTNGVKNTGTVTTEKKNTGTVSEEGTNTGTVKNGGTTTDGGNTTTKNTGTVQHDITNTGTVKNEGSETPGVTTTRTVEGGATRDDSIYGFNSTTPVPSTKEAGSNNSTETETHAGSNSRTDTRTDNLTTQDKRTDNTEAVETRNLTETVDLTRTDNLQHGNTRTDNLQENTTLTNDLSEDGTRTDDLAHHVEHKLKRSGNIGVTTSQQMIESERELWMWEYFSVVFADLDKILALPIY